MLKSSSLCLYSSNLGTFWPFEEISIFSNSAAKLKIEKGGMKFKKSSPLKLLSQSQPSFAEMILGWFPSKFMSDISDLRPRWPPHHQTQFWKRTIQ
jgi:hypothetical protein